MMNFKLPNLFGFSVEQIIKTIACIVLLVWGIQMLFSAIPLKTMNILVKPLFSNKFETFQVFYRQGKLGYNANRSKTHKVEKKWTYKNRNSKKLVFELPRNTTDQIRIDPGEHESLWRIQKVTFHTHFLGYYPEVMVWDMDSFIEQATPLQLTELNEEEPGVLTVRNLGGDANFAIPFDTDLYTKTINSTILKGVYLLLMLAGMWLIWRFNFRAVLTYLTSLLRCSRADGDQLSQQFRTMWSVRQRWIWAGGVLFVIANLARLWPYLATPSLHGEDSIEFSDFYNGRELSDSEAWRYYRGYTVVLMRLVAWFCTRFPIEWQPIVFATAGVLFATIAIFVTAWCGLLQRRSIILIAPIALGLLGMNHAIFYLSVTEILYSGVLIVFALLFYPAPRNKIVYGLLLVLMCFLVWSGPYSVQLVPVALALVALFYDKRKAVLLILVAVSAFLYLKSSASGLLQIENVLIPGVHHAFMRAMLEKIFLFGMFHNIHYLVALGLLLSMTGLVYCLRQDRQYIKVATILMGLIISSMLSYFISVKYTQYGGEIIEAHTILSQYAWVLLLLYTADRILLKFSKDTFSMASVLIIGLFVGVTVFSQFRQPERYQHNFDKELPGFFESIRLMEKREQSLIEQNQYVILWHINSESLVMDVRIGSDEEDAVQLSYKDVPKRIHHYVHDGPIKRKRGRILRI